MKRIKRLMFLMTLPILLSAIGIIYILCVVVIEPTKLLYHYSKFGQKEPLPCSWDYIADHLDELLKSISKN